MTKTAKLSTALVVMLFVVGACSGDDGVDTVDPADAGSSTTEASAEDSTTAAPTTEAATSEASTESSSSDDSGDVPADVGPQHEPSARALNML